MKVLFISNLFPPHFIGGYEIACKDTYQLLNDNKVECKVLTSDFTNNDYLNNKLNISKKSEIDVLRILKLHTDFKSPKNTLNYNLIDKQNARIISEYVELFQPDIIYCWNIYGLGTGFLSNINSKRTVFHIMDLSVLIYQFTFIKWLKSFIFSNRNKTTEFSKYLRNAIFISNFVAEKFSKFQLWNKSVIYPFLEESSSDLIKFEYSTKDIWKCVFIGQIEHHKGVIELCKTLKEINNVFGNQKFQLHIYGASLSGLEDAINNEFDFVSIFKGWPRERIFKKLKTYDIGFFPSVWEEPFGIAQIEMMAIGLPVFSSGRGGSKEVLNINNSIQFSDFNDLKNKLIQFINEYPILAPQIGQNAYMEIKFLHNSERYIKQLLIFFKHVIESEYEN